MPTPDVLALPVGFDSINDLLESKKPAGTIVDVIGLVSDFRAPTPTKGKDWKCQISLYDVSIQWDHEASLDVHFFMAKDRMPDATCGDVIVLKRVKIQDRQGDASLLTTNQTAVYVFSASKIPTPPTEASKALVGRPTKQPSKAEYQYVSILYHGIDKGRLPTETEFELRKIQSANVKEKFCLLKDVRDQQFCNLMVQVVKDPRDLGDKIAIWVSDFSENVGFHNYTLGDAESGKMNDPYGYGAKAKAPNSKVAKTGWTGPLGRRSIQITCWEPHASAIRSEGIKDGSWVDLRNIQITYGRDGANLEGFLREDRGSHGYRLGISPVDPTDDPETIDPRLKETIRRKRDYEKEMKYQLKALTEAASAGQKRKADTSVSTKPVAMNSKERRKAKRIQGPRAAEGPQSMEDAPVPDLNPLIKCENQNKRASSVAQILAPSYHKITIDGNELSLRMPFKNSEFRTNVRVVDYWPPKLEDFARAKKKTSIYDSLSDNEDWSSDSESDKDLMTKYTTVRDWEWHFRLALEDATAGENEQKQTLWAVVDDQSAQCLLSLDASNLRQNSGELDTLRDKLFYLWGDLEEHKRQAEAKTVRRARNDLPPPDSSDASSGQGSLQHGTVANRPFSCCIREFGVKVSAKDPSKAGDAGDGKQWERVFKFFGARLTGA